MMEGQGQRPTKQPRELAAKPHSYEAIFFAAGRKSDWLGRSEATAPADSVSPGKKRIRSAFLTNRSLWSVA